ncbi:hypothetical protein, partial [Enterococcus casseliflavus]|uniref:hypothetical protein n=1 Tax=Enterococcus casseliflavus TaxID=37734 RepID=UPI003D0BCEAC
GLFLLSPKAIEYAAPLTAMVLARLVWSAGRPRTWALIMALAASITLVPAGVAWHVWPPTPSVRGALSLAAVDLLPADAGGAKVFTCEWHP